MDFNSLQSLRSEVQEFLTEVPAEFKAIPFSNFAVLAHFLRDMRSATNSDTNRGLAEFHRVERLHRQSDVLLQELLVANENYKQLNQETRSFGEVLENMKNAQKHVVTVKNSMLRCKEALSRTGFDLEQLWIQSLHYGQTLKLLDKLDGLAALPGKLSSAIEGKHFLYAIQLMQNAERVMSSEELRNIRGLSGVREALESSKEGLFDHILVSVQSHLFLKRAPFEFFLSSSPEEEVSDRRGRGDELVGSSIFDSLQQGPQLTRESSMPTFKPDVAHTLFGSFYREFRGDSATAEIVDDPQSDAEEDSRHFIQICVSALDKIGRLSDAQNAILQRLRFEIRSSIDEHTYFFYQKLAESLPELERLSLLRRVSALPGAKSALKGKQQTLSAEEKEREGATGHNLVTDPSDPASQLSLADLFSSLFNRLESILQMFAFATSTIETVEQVSREARQSRRRGAVSEGGKSKVKTLRSALNENDIYQIRSALERKLKEYGEDKRSNGVFVAALKNFVEDFLRSQAKRFANNREVNGEHLIEIFSQTIRAEAVMTTRSTGKKLSTAEVDNMVRPFMREFRGILSALLDPTMLSSLLTAGAVWEAVQIEVQAFVVEYLDSRESALNSEIVPLDGVWDYIYQKPPRQEDRVSFSFLDSAASASTVRPSVISVASLPLGGGGGSAGQTVGDSRTGKPRASRTLNVDAISKDLRKTPYNMLQFFKPLMLFIEHCTQILSSSSSSDSSVSFGNIPGGASSSTSRNFHLLHDFVSKFNCNTFIPMVRSDCVEEAKAALHASYAFKPSTSKDVHLPFGSRDHQRPLVNCVGPLFRQVKELFDSSRRVPHYGSEFLGVTCTLLHMFQVEVERVSNRITEGTLGGRFYFREDAEKAVVNDPLAILVFNPMGAAVPFEEMEVGEDVEAFLMRVPVDAEVLVESDRRYERAVWQEFLALREIRPRDILLETTKFITLSNLHDSLEYFLDEVDQLDFGELNIGTMTEEMSNLAAFAVMASSSAASADSQSYDDLLRFHRRRYEEGLSEYEGLLEQLRKLSRRLLGQLKVDVQARCFYFLASMKQSSYEIGDGLTLPENFVLNFNRNLLTLRETMMTYLGPLKTRFLLDGLEQLIPWIVMNSVPHLQHRFFNSNGIGRMQRNLIALQQGLANILPQLRETITQRFDRARKFFEMLLLKERELMVVFENPQLKDMFTFEEWLIIAESSTECRDPCSAEFIDLLESNVSQGHILRNSDRFHHQ